MIQAVLTRETHFDHQVFSRCDHCLKRHFQGAHDWRCNGKWLQDKSICKPDWRNDARRFNTQLTSAGCLVVAAGGLGCGGG